MEEKWLIGPDGEMINSNHVCWWMLEFKKRHVCFVYNMMGDPTEEYEVVISKAPEDLSDTETQEIIEGFIELFLNTQKVFNMEESLEAAIGIAKICKDNR